MTNTLVYNARVLITTVKKFYGKDSMTSMCDANEVNGTVGQSYKDFYKRSLHGDSQET